jgi:hypothetical protein
MIMDILKLQYLPCIYKLTFHSYAPKKFDLFIVNLGVY